MGGPRPGLRSGKAGGWPSNLQACRPTPRAPALAEASFPSSVTLFLSAGVWDQKAGGVGPGHICPPLGQPSAWEGRRVRGKHNAPGGPGAPAWPPLTAQHCAPGPQEAGPPPAGPDFALDSTPGPQQSWACPAPCHCSEAQPAARRWHSCPSARVAREALRPPWPCADWVLLYACAALSATAPTFLPLTEVE